jgi:hypothetical protein
MRRYLGIFLLDASPEVLEPSFPEFPESGLGVRCTPSLGGLVFSEVGLSGPANGWPRTRLSSPSLSRVDPVNQGPHLMSFERSRLFTLSSLELGELAYVGGEAGFVVLIVEPHPLPSLEQIFQRKI